MRNYAGFVLTVLGAFCLVATALLRFWIAPDVEHASKYPLGEYEVLHLAGTGTYFNKGKLQEELNVSVSVAYTIKGNVARGTGSTAIWDYFTDAYDVTDHQTISYTLAQEALSRTTGQVINCCGAYITDMPTGKPDHSDHMSGLATFPLGDRPQTYLMFDSTTGTAESDKYAGLASVEGILTYKYVEKVSPTRLGTIDVPGSLIGQPSQGEIPLGEYYSTVNTYYVDPQTGGVLDVSEDPAITIGASPTNVAIIGSQISVTETAPSIAAVVRQDEHARGELTLATVTLPVTGLVAGILLLAAGIFVLWRDANRARAGSRWLPGADLDDPGKTDPRWGEGAGLRA